MSRENIFDTKVLPEPLIEFGHGQSVTNPRHGLSVFGPYDINLSSHPEKINYAIMGDKRGAELFSRFSTAWIGPLYTNEDMNAMIWPNFPGFESVFQTKWPTEPVAKFVFQESELSKACEIRELDRRVKTVVDFFVEGVRIISKTDDKKDVIICIVPDFVFQSCRPKSDGAKRKFTKRKTAVQMTLFSEAEDEDFESFSTDFRRQLKARIMEFNIPIQIIRESTLALTSEETNDVRSKLKRGLTPASDRAWNLGTTIFYKAGGKPWKLSNVRDGVCYIGIAYRTPTRASSALGLFDT